MVTKTNKRCNECQSLMNVEYIEICINGILTKIALMSCIGCGHIEIPRQYIK